MLGRPYADRYSEPERSWIAEQIRLRIDPQPYQALVNITIKKNTPDILLVVNFFAGQPQTDIQARPERA